MKKINYISLNETVYHETMENGLNVFFIPKKGFTKTYVSMSTNLGSLVTSVKVDNVVKELPHGIAHFLEHKLFEQNNEDVSKEFAKNHASVNAYTQSNRTTYLFSCTANLIENIDLLLNFVQNPFFTDKGIEKEKGIITQEMKMYEDDVNSVSYYGLLNNMYFNHPIKNDILGTKESLIAINKENLILAHKYYYNPSNMVMIVTGNIDPNTIMDHIRSSDLLQKSRSFEQEDITIEPNDVVKANGESELDIMIPHYLFGIKLSPLSTTSKEMMKEQLVLSILSEIIMGRSSKFYNELMDQELINESFGANITLEDSYGYMILGGETEKPKELNTVIIDFMKSLETYSIDESDFIRTKKQILGGFIQSLNSLDFIANSFTKYYYHDMSLFEILDITAAIKISDIKKAKQLLINEHSYSSYTVYPKTNKK